MKFARLGTLLFAAILAFGAQAIESKADDSKTIIFLAGPSSDPFWGAVQQGFDTATKDLGDKVTTQWSAPQDFTDIVPVFTRMMEAAIARKPAAIVVGNFFPDTLEPLIKQAVGEGIAVLVYNSGRLNWKEIGSIGFIGEDPWLMGNAGGKIAVAKGVKNGLCINQIAANPVLEMRCKGYIDAIVEGGGQAKLVTLPSEDIGNSQKVQAAVSAMLMADQTIDGVITLGAAVAVDALESVKVVRASGRKVDLGTIDLGQVVLEAVRDGEMSYAIDQQPFLQGYLGVLLSHQYINYRLAVATEINTGPFIIDQSNAAAVLAVGEKYPGSRGAN
jgi:simple sugar transport system substrate-binding protein